MRWNKVNRIRDYPRKSAVEISSGFTILKPFWTSLNRNERFQSQMRNRQSRMTRSLSEY